jgi:hypothetical protein
MNFLFSSEKSDEHNVRIWSIIGTVLVWASVWYLLELCLAHLPKRTQIMAHVIVLAVGVVILRRVSKEGFL